MITHAEYNVIFYMCGAGEMAKYAKRAPECLFVVCVCVCVCAVLVEN